MYTPRPDFPTSLRGSKVGEYLVTLLTAYPNMTIGSIILNAVVAHDTMAGRETSLDSFNRISDADLVQTLGTFAAAYPSNPDLEPGLTKPPTINTPAMKFNLPVEDLPTSQELFATVKVLKATGADPSVYGPFEEQALRTQHAERIIDRLAKTLTETIWPKSKFEERGKGDQERYKEAAANLVVEMERNGWSRLPADGGAVLSHAEVEVLTNILRRTQTNDQNRDLIRRFVGAKR